MPLKVNGVEYEWGDVTITVLGRTLERVTEIEYDIEVDKKHLYGRGRKPKGIANGNEKPQGSVTLGQSEVEAMIRVAQQLRPGGKITDLSFDIQVHYLQGTELVKDRVIAAAPTKQPKGLKQGDTDMQVKIPFLCEDVQYNI